MIQYGSDPFALPAELRDPVRRFRGRLASPVTVWTSSDEDGLPVGITVSSMMVSEGSPSTVVGLIDPLSQFWAALSSSKRFVVHVLERHHRRLSDQMAGRYPGPDARFENVEVRPSPWGPVIDGSQTRACCHLTGFLEAGDALVVNGEIEEVVLGDDLESPLVYFRGKYHDLTPRRSGRADPLT